MNNESGVYLWCCYINWAHLVYGIKYLSCAAFKIKLTTVSGNAGMWEKLHDRSRIRLRQKAGVCVCVQAPLEFRMCLSHLIYTVRPCLIHTCHAAPMPCSDHAVLLKATAQHGRRETACGLPALLRLLPATTPSSTKFVIRSIPILLTTIHTYDCKEW
jgi:hypothetical protein